MGMKRVFEGSVLFLFLKNKNKEHIFLSIITISIYLLS